MPNGIDRRDEASKRLRDDTFTYRDPGSHRAFRGYLIEQIFRIFPTVATTLNQANGR
jgi:hypothetical protein